MSGVLATVLSQVLGIVLPNHSPHSYALLSGRREAHDVPNVLVLAGHSVDGSCREDGFYEPVEIHVSNILDSLITGCVVPGA